MWLLIACAGGEDTASPKEEGCVAGEPEAYEVPFGTEPDPLVAGEEGTLQWRVLDEDGCAIEDLQQSHERIGHVLVVSADLDSFQHVHHEDYAELTADDLRSSTYHLPLTVPTSGDYLVVLDYAHRNRWLQATEVLTVAGEPAQRDAPEEDFSTVVTADDVEVALTWIAEPVAGYEASWQVHLTSGGADVTDLVQYLGADAHAAAVSADFAWAGHTHAYVQGMETMTPTMEMPHAYDGPDVLFKTVFPTPGLHGMWLQFTRAGDPSHVYTAPFRFVVGG
ncbi:MAG: hypothetical protein ACOZNI_37050 [Myxococcota bacterium]